MSERLNVDEPAKLLEFLKARLDGWRPRTVKERLRLGCIRVNGETVTQFDTPLQPGDKIEVDRREAGTRQSTRQAPFVTLYSDSDLIAIDKPAGLLSVATERERGRTALALLRQMLSAKRKPSKLWPVHRLDRETSGVLLFARSREICQQLQSTWAESSKLYLAIVEGHVEPPDGVIDRALVEDRSLNVKVREEPGARDAVTHYRTLEKGPDRSLLEVSLATGRRHQIRAHLAWMGHPIVGDPRYGTRASRMALHAQRLSVQHPRTGERLQFEAAAPSEFEGLLAGRR